MSSRSVILAWFLYLRITFNKHDDTIVSKAKRVLWLMMRSLQARQKVGTIQCQAIVTAY